MAEQSQLSLGDIVAILRRRALLLAGVFGLMVVSSIVFVLLLPRMYEASGTILVESQRVPAELVEGTATQFADERIAIIQQRTMTRESLLRIAQKHGLHDGAVDSSTEFVEGMRARIGVELIGADLHGPRQGTGALAFKLSFEDQDPQVAYDIANELVTLFLDENLKARTERANETTKFFAVEAERLKAELDLLEDRVAAYKQEHGDALPEHLGLRMGLMQRLETELKEAEREYKTKQDELALLGIELGAARTGVSVPQDASQLTPAQELQTLHTELEGMSQRFTDNHPDVRDLKRRIEALESMVGVGDANGRKASKPMPNSPADLVAVRIEARIASVQARLTALSAEREALQDRLHEVEDQILQGPQVERALATLMRDHGNARARYEEVRARQMQAQMAENLEEGNKAERFILLEPPLLPEKPTKPNRKKILAQALFIAIACSGGLVMLLEAFDDRVRGRKALTAVLHEPPLVVIPYLITGAEIARRSQAIRTGGLVAVALMLAVLVAAYFLYRPLNLLAGEFLTNIL